MDAYRLGLIGAGNMAESIVRGALAARVITPGRVAVSDPSPDRRRLFAEELRVVALEDNRALVERSDVVILAVKPQTADVVMAQVGPLLGPPRLLVSIAAGVTVSRLALACPPGSRIIRTMPNTPMLVGRGLVAMSRGPAATDEDLRRARDLFASSATVVELGEEKMDAVTAVSGSGPAYFFYLVEALIEAGKAAGLSPDEASQLAATTFTGAAELLARSGATPAELRRRVTSPGGTTAAAIASLEADRFFEILARAVRAAADRSRVLGR